MTEMNTWLSAIGELGVYVGIIVCLFIFLFKIIEQIMKDNKSREEMSSQTMNEITKSIKETSETNKSLAETNRLLVDRISYDLNEIKNMLNKEDN